MANRSPIKYAGGKTLLADEIVNVMKTVKHIHYVEPYCGGCSVFFSRPRDFKWDGKNEGCSTVMNDIDRNLIAFWKVLKDPHKANLFRARLELLKFHEGIFEDAKAALAEDDPAMSDLDRMTFFWIRSRMSRGSLGKSFVTPVRTRLRRGIQDQVSAYLSSVDGLDEFNKRTKDVMFLCRPAIEVIEKEDGPGTLFYCDPPYLHATRTCADLYDHEMAAEDHHEMLTALKRIHGHAILSSYPNAMYDSYLKGWNTKDITTRKSLSSKTLKEPVIERLYFNF
jgi:DNA adenine methylase